jgi:hypothetical protein
MGRRNRPKSARLGLTTKEESTMLSSEDAFVSYKHGGKAY